MVVTCDYSPDRQLNDCPPDTHCREYALHPEWKSLIQNKTNPGDDGICTCEYYPDIPSTMCPGNQFLSSTTFGIFFYGNLWTAAMCLPLLAMLLRTMYRMVRAGKFKPRAPNGLTLALLTVIAQCVFLMAQGIMIVLGMVNVDPHERLYNLALPVITALFGTFVCATVLVVAWSWTFLVARTEHFSERFVMGTRVFLTAIGVFYFGWILASWAILFDINLLTTGTTVVIVLDALICYAAARGVRRTFSIQFTASLRRASSGAEFPRKKSFFRRLSRSLSSGSAGDAPPSPLSATTQAYQSNVTPFVVAVYETGVGLLIGLLVGLAGILMFGSFDSVNIIGFEIGFLTIFHVTVFHSIAVNDYIRFVLLEDRRWTFNWRRVYLFLEWVLCGCCCAPTGSDALSPCNSPSGNPTRSCLRTARDDKEAPSPVGHVGIPEITLHLPSTIEVTRSILPAPSTVDSEASSRYDDPV